MSGAERPRPLGAALLLLGLLVVAAALRASALGTDPPPWMEEAFLIDGGWWAASARAWLVDGDPRGGDYGLVFALFPLYAWLLQETFAVFGVASASQRGLSAAASLLALLCVVLAARREGSPRLAVATAVLLALSPLYFAQGSAELPDPVQGGFVVASFALFVSRGAPWLLGAGAGLAMGLAVAVKPTAIATGGLALAFTCGLQLAAARSRAESVRPVLERAAGAVAALGCVAIALIAVHLLPQRELVEQAIAVSPENYQLGWASALANPGLALLSKSLLVEDWWPVPWRVETFAPAIFLGAWCAALALAVDPDGPRRALLRLSDLERGALAWCVGWSLTIFLAPGQPDYRYTAILPVLAIPAASALLAAMGARPADAATQAPPSRLGAIALAALLGLPLLLPLKAVLTALAMQLGESIPLGDDPGVELAPAGTLATLACLAIAALGAASPRGVLRAARAVRGRRVLLLLGTALVMELALLAPHLARRSHSLEETQARLRALVPAGATIAAPLASSALLPLPVTPVRRLEPTRAPLDARDPAWDRVRPAFFLFPVTLNFAEWRPGEETERVLAARGYVVRETLALAPRADGTPRFTLRLMQDAATPR